MEQQTVASTQITIKFTEQQIELIQRLADEMGKTRAEAVAIVLAEFVRGHGSQYMG